MKQTIHPSTAADARGFALVVSLVMMILLALIAVGMLGLSSITLRAGATESAAREARSNALLALQLAMADLQRHAGPDQRVTAPRELVRDGDADGRWTGVWSTVARSGAGGEPAPDRPLIGNHEGAAWMVDLREQDTSLAGGKWRDELRLAWLVSGAGEGAAGNTQRIPLVGEGTLGDNVRGADLVTAPRVAVPGGGYAWWVGDESVKANLNTGASGRFANASASSPETMTALVGTAGPAPAMFTAATAATSYDNLAALDNDERVKIPSRNQASLVAGGDPGADFHEASVSSYGVFASTGRGGLKRDLTTLMEQPRGNGNGVGVTFASNPFDLEPLEPGAPIIPLSRRQSTGPTFDQLAAWYRLMDETGNGPVGAATHDMRLPAARQSTADGGHSDMRLREGWTVELLDDAGGGETQPLHPLVADFLYYFDFSIDTQRAGGRAVRTHIYPRLTLWNPYNTRLTGQRFVVMVPVKTFTTHLQVGGNAVTVIPGTSSGAARIFPGQRGNPGFMAFTVEAVDFEPGEVLVFSPKPSASSQPRIGGNSVRYDEGNLANNVLSATTPPGLQNFHFDSDYQVPGVTPPGSRLPVAVDGQPYEVFNRSSSNALTPTMYELAVHLKRADGGGAIPPTALTGSSHATIHRLQVHFNGHEPRRISGRFRESDRAMNEVFPDAGIRPYEQRANRPPPALWNYRVRLRHFTEDEEFNAYVNGWVNRAGSTGASSVSPQLYHTPVLANFNVRASAVFRSPFCFFNHYSSYAPGAYIIPWGARRPFGSDGDPLMVNGRFRGSPFARPGQWSRNRGIYPLFDVPHPGVGVHSIAAFQHANVARFSWQPSYIIGHSLADPRSDRQRTANRSHATASDPWNGSFSYGTRSAMWGDLTQSGRQSSELLAYDIVHETNHHLWDDFFLSGIPFQRGSGASPRVIWQPENDPLPNRRHVLNPWFGVDAADLRERLNNGHGGYDSTSRTGHAFHHAAHFLLNEGAFNVNSTSMNAWATVLGSTLGIATPTQNGGDLDGAFPRLKVPGMNVRGSFDEPAGWLGSPALSEAEIRRLAAAMVDEVKSRGPFISVADFVNRRLTAPTPLSGGLQNPRDPSTRGALQSAIDVAGLNAALQRNDDNHRIDRRANPGANQGDGMVRPDMDASTDWKAYGLPSYLTQADVLQKIGPMLTTRGDTFIIRAYGESADRGGRVLARAWIEAKVQRTPDFVNATPPTATSRDEGNLAAEPVTVRTASGALTVNPRLDPVNQRFGRRFVLKSMRWLSPDEV